MSSPQDGEVRAAYQKWIHSLPKCLGDSIGCDGDLVGLPHDPGCPMFGKEFANLFDAWQASRIAAFDRAIEIAKEYLRDAELAAALTRERDGE